MQDPRSYMASRGAKKSKTNLERENKMLKEKLDNTKLELKIQTLQKKIDDLENAEKHETDKQIVIYREYRTHNLINARVMEITATFYLWVPAGSDVWLYELPGYLPSLEAETSDGKTTLPILSDDELNLLFTNKNAKFVTQDSLRSLYYEQIKKIETTKTDVTKSKESSHIVGIIIPQLGINHFQEVVLKWTEQIKSEEVSESNISQYVKRRHTIEPTTDNSVYINISMDKKKYELIKEPEISAVDNKKQPVKITDGEEYKKILKDKTQSVYRIRRHTPLTFTIKWAIGIPSMVRQWAWAGFFIAIPVLLFSAVMFFAADNSFFENITKLLAGLIAMLVGFRVLLFHDTELMSRWNIIYLILLGISVFLIILMYSVMVNST